MRRSFIGIVAAVLLWTALGGTALAGSQWCVNDPTIVVEGRQSKVAVSFDAAYSPVTQGIALVIHAPSNVSVSVSSGATPVPETASVVYDLAAWDGDSAIHLRVDVTVRASASFRTETTVWRPDAKLLTEKGTSGQTTSIKYDLRR